jgi:hypothetical protein
LKYIYNNLITAQNGNGTREGGFAFLEGLDSFSPKTKSPLNYFRL